MPKFSTLTREERAAQREPSAWSAEPLDCNRYAVTCAPTGRTMEIIFHPGMVEVASDSGATYFIIDGRCNCPAAQREPYCLHRAASAAADREQDRVEADIAHARAAFAVPDLCCQVAQGVPESAGDGAAVAETKRRLAMLHQLT